MKRTPLKRTEFKRKPAKDRTSRPPNVSINFSEKVKRSVLRRSWGNCEVGLPGCACQVEQFHHRRLRSQGGKGTLANALGVCRFCHAAIHANPQWSYLHGLLVRSHHDPAEIKVFSGCPPDCRTNHTFPAPFDFQPSRP